MSHPLLEALMTTLNIIKPLFLLLNLSFFISFAPLSQASDMAKEKRWSEQIVDSLLVGDAVWLNDGKSKFLALFADNTTPKAQGAMIVVHGIGVHPNWPDVILPIRSEFPDHGWATLSIQMPILGNDKSEKDYIPLFKEVDARLKAAVNFLKKKSFKNIAIVAHSLGATMSNQYLSAKPDSTVRAYVAISMSNNPKVKEFNNVKKLSQIKNIPVLDIFGSQDLDSVMKYAKARAQAGKKANKRYSQKKINGADHFYQSKNEPLIRTIRLWLKKNAAGKEIKQ